MKLTPKNPQVLQLRAQVKAAREQDLLDDRKLAKEFGKLVSKAMKPMRSGKEVEAKK